MKLIGLHDALRKLAKAPKVAIKWGIKAKESSERLQQKPAPAEKKKHRKAVEASKRRNRK